MKRLNSAWVYFLFVTAIMGIICSRDSWGQTPHTASYTITASQCTIASPCTAAIYRVVVPNGACPSAWDAKYIQVQSALSPIPSNVTPTGTTWFYTDSGASLVSGAIYCGYSTVANGGGPSQASAVFQGQIPTPPVVPSAPVNKVILAELAIETLRGLVG